MNHSSGLNLHSPAAPAAMTRPVAAPAPGVAGGPSSREARAALEVELVFGESTVVSAFATSPLKLLTPQSRGPGVWAYTSTFGGGLVAGDQTRLDVRVGAGARCFIGTQASTKVYRNPSQLPCSHTTRATTESGSLLVFAPDPVQPFAGSIYTQRQEFHLAAGAGLALVDSFTSGRAACGERWAFSRLWSRNAVWLAGEPIFLDSLLLDGARASLPGPHCVGRFNCFALLLLVGSPLQDAARRLLERIGSRPVARRAPLVCSASAVTDGVVLRAAGEAVQDVGRELQRHLEPLRDALGGNPSSRKW
jgi:urease accessory protein